MIFVILVKRVHIEDSCLVFIEVTEQWESEDDNIAEHADGVEDAEETDQLKEGGLQVELVAADHLKRNKVA